MNEILRITFKLTFSCLVAALVMGAVFTVTDKAKKHNEHMNVQTTMLELLGYGSDDPPPPDLEFHHVYRYIITDSEKQFLGFMVPVEKEGKEIYELLVLGLDGTFIENKEIPISPEEAIEAPERSKALKSVVEADFTYADSSIIATRGDRRTAYLLPGEFPGFKTFISVILALDSEFSVLGLEVMEHEEDPGLGGEIEQPYFQNQFRGKSFEQIRQLDVVKEPLPEEYRSYLLETSAEGFSKEDIERIKERYVSGDDIYALTGATISSVAVTQGVKNIVQKFAYRLRTLDQAIADQNVPVTF